MCFPGSHSNFSKLLEKAYESDKRNIISNWKELFSLFTKEETPEIVPPCFSRGPGYASKYSGNWETNSNAPGLQGIFIDKCRQYQNFVGNLQARK